jgi:hypothetical protein
MENSNDSFVNQITIDYLMNNDRYNKYMDIDKNKKLNKKDKKFYRKRILSLTKEFLLNSNHETTPEIKYHFDNYINCCIHYFKNLDSNDLLQKDYDNNLLNEKDEKNIDLENVNADFNKANSDLIKSFSNESTLDDFVVKTKKPTSIILPTERVINLKDSNLRVKGVKKFKKKKNINNIYEEKNTKEKDEKNNIQENTKMSNT